MAYRCGRAREAGDKVHFGALMPICVEKNYELPENDERRKFKGRVVFRGDIVRDETGFYATFSEQGTHASLMEAAKFVDAVARLQDCDGEEADATGAYLQAELG